VNTQAAPRPAGGRPSAYAAGLYADLMALPPAVRGGFYGGLSAEDVAALLAVAEQETGTPYGLWEDDPVGFAAVVLGDALWSKQEEILSSVAVREEVYVPSCFGSSKTRTAAVATLWWLYTRPPGLSRVVTLAPYWRQVEKLTWPEIRMLHGHAGLPGHVDTTQLKLRDANAVETVVAYGMSPPAHDEAAVQGIHAPGGVLMLVEEAGGIAASIGDNLSGVLTGGKSRILAIGNPPTDDQGTWFERMCQRDDVRVITIPTSVTPNFTGETTPTCRTCPDVEHRPHPLSVHLVDQAWVAARLKSHGDDSPYIRAKIHAKFPTGGPRQVIPADWVEASAESPEPAAGRRLCDLDLPDETAAWRVQNGAWVRLGVDVAADGGDELAISRSIGDLVTVEHTSSGQVNANAVTVAGAVLEHIRRAEAVRRALGTAARVRVKIDGIGVGWGVASVLSAWAAEQVHDAEIVVVIVSESTNRDPDGIEERPWRKRDEMWLAGRTLFRPEQATGRCLIRCRTDRATLAQLSAPRKGSNSGGWTVVEAKKAMKDRGISSPDRAESVLLAVYEPAVEHEVRIIV